jgi:hypothetical protein
MSFFTVDAALASVLSCTIAILTPIAALVHIERNVTTISHLGVSYTLEVSTPRGINVSFMPHRHVLKQVFPTQTRKGARLYFSLEPCSFFHEYPVLNLFDIHSHNGNIWDWTTPPVFYIGDGNLIYDHDTGKPYTHTHPHLSHTHEITVLHISAAQDLNNPSRHRRKR